MTYKIAHDDFINDFNKLLLSDREFVVERRNAFDVSVYIVTIFNSDSDDSSGGGDVIETVHENLEVALEGAVKSL